MQGKDSLSYQLYMCLPDSQHLLGCSSKPYYHCTCFNTKYILTTTHTGTGWVQGGQGCTATSCTGGAPFRLEDCVLWAVCFTVGSEWQGELQVWPHWRAFRHVCRQGGHGPKWQRCGYGGMYREKGKGRPEREGGLQSLQTVLHYQQLKHLQVCSYKCTKPTSQFEFGATYMCLPRERTWKCICNCY